MLLADGSSDRPLLVLPLTVFLFLGLAGPALSQSSDQNQSQDQIVQKAFQEAKWTKGPAIAQLETIAEVRLPEGFMATKGDDTRRILEAMQNPPSGREVGLIINIPEDWFVVFQFDDIGYVKDDERGSLDPNAMLESIKRGTEQGNKERAMRGWAPFTVIGWEQPPNYDPQTHNLQWAIRGESQGQPVVNYNTRLLGRNGVMGVTLVVDPPLLQKTLPQFRVLLGGYTFTKGKGYAEWVPGDKVAAIGLTALVTGGAAAVAVKSGLFKYLWKILLVAGAGFLAFARKIFKRHSA